MLTKGIFSQPLVVSGPVSLSDNWPDGVNPGTTYSAHQTFFFDVMDSGTDYANELIDAGPTSEHTKQQVNQTILYWFNGKDNVHPDIKELHQTHADFWSQIGEVHDGNYVDSGSTQEATARRLLDTWADYSTAMQATKPDYVDLIGWAQQNNVFITPGFV